MSTQSPRGTAKHRIKRGRQKGTFSHPLKRKLLLLLAGAGAIGLTHHGRTSWKIIRATQREWAKLNMPEVVKSFREFHERRLVTWVEHDDGSITITLTKQGEIHAMRQKIDSMELRKPLVWDKKWRLVVFDIPENKRAERDALRKKLKELGLRELQRSLLITQFPCKDEINFIVEFFELRPYVRFLECNEITPDEDLQRAR